MQNETPVKIADMDQRSAAADGSAAPHSADTAESERQRLAKTWLKRINDYLKESLENPAPEEAVLGATNSNLMRVAFRLNEAIERVLAERSDPFDHLGTLLQATDAVCKITRQIERYSRLKHLLMEAHHALRVPKKG